MSELGNKNENRIQAPIRLEEADYNNIRERAKEQGLTYQKLAEFLLKAYIQGNKEICNAVEKYVEQKKLRKGKTFDELERSAILDAIERESVLKF